MKAFLFLACQLPLWAVVTGFDGHGWWTFYLVLWTFVITPPLDLLLGRDRKDPGAPGDEPGLRDDLHQWVLWTPVVTAPLLLVWALEIAGTQDLPAVEFVGLGTSLGLAMGTTAITTAHELIHGRSRVRRATGTALLLLVTYPHFRIEHVFGHHARVATPDDPATARRGESIYRFYWRTIPAQLASAWRLEEARLRRMRKTAWSSSNRMLWYGAGVAGLYAGALIWFGLGGAGLMLLQSAVAILLLETVNYIEHYGLQRKKIRPGRYEKPGVLHSWDAYQRATNFFTFNLGRHADHHLRPSTPYQRLRTRPEAPQMPGGYATMLGLALLPPLWFRVMHARLDRSPAARRSRTACEERGVEKGVGTGTSSTPA